jgi:hypothetical protein
MRNFLLQEDYAAASEYLLTTPVDNPSFSIDVIKASFVNSPDLAQPLWSSSAALLSAGHVDDAVDIFMLTQQFGEAGMALIDLEAIELVVQMVKAANGEFDRRGLINQLVRCLLKQGNWKSAAALLVAVRLFQQAGEILAANGFTFPGEIVSSLRKEGNQWCYGSQKTLLCL